MSNLANSLTTIRYFTAADPYFYTVDNRPLTDISASLVTVATYIDTRYGIAAPAISSNTLTVDLSAGSNFTVALNANINTFNINNLLTTGLNEFTIVFTADGTLRTIGGINSVVKWAGGTAPTMTSTNGKKDIFTFRTFDQGTNWYARIYGQNF